MTEQEEKVHNIDKRQDSFETFVRAYIENNNERMAKMDERMRQMDERMNRMDEKFDQMNSRIDNIANSVHNISIAAMVGIGAMAVSVVAFVGMAIYRG